MDQIQQAPSNDPSEPAETFGWKTAVNYALISILMLGLAFFVYSERLEADLHRQRAELVRQQDANAFFGELQAVLQKKEALQEAQSQVATLGREIQNLPTIGAQDKGRLFGTINTIDSQLRVVDSQIEELGRQVESFRRTSIARPNFSLGFISAAYAQSQNVMTPETRKGFALISFLIITSIMGYCLWMIAKAAPVTTNKVAIAAFNSDRKWARELLNKQLVFLGGLVIGIVLK